MVNQYHSVPGGPLGLPEGPWRCRWRQTWCQGLEELTLTLRGTALEAEGVDEDGTFRHSGALYANGTASFAKVYSLAVKSVPLSMSYIGSWDGTAIRGEWIDDAHLDNHGPFVMWPGGGPEPPLTLRRSAPLAGEATTEDDLIPVLVRNGESGGSGGYRA